MAATDEGGRNWAVALVHGVGHTESIEMIRLVTDAVRHARTDLVIDENTVVHEPRTWRQGEVESSYVPTKQHARHGAIGGSKVRFATAFWSDVAFIGEGLVQLIGSLALGGLGVRYFADVSTSGRSATTRLLHFLLTFMILLLALGFLPLVMCSLLLSTMALLAIYFFEGRTYFAQAPFIALGTLAVALFVYWLGVTRLWKMRRERRLAIPIFNVFLGLCILMAALILIDHPRGLGVVDFDTNQGRSVLNGLIASGLQWAMEFYGWLSGNKHYAERLELLDGTSRYIAFLQLLQYICGFGVIFSTAAVLIVLVVNLILPGQRKGQWRSYLLGAVSVITMWSLMLLVLWPENLVTSSAINSYYASSQKDWTPRNQHYGFSVREWSFKEVPIKSLDDFQKVIPLLWFDLYFFVFLILVAVAAGCLIVGRQASRIKNRSKDPEHLNRFRPAADSCLPPRRCRPRLVLASLYQIAVLVFMFAISATVIAHLTAHLAQTDRWVAENILRIGVPKEHVPHEVVLNSAHVALGVGTGLILFVVLAHLIKQAVKLALDVVNHFAAPSHGFPIRRRIASRLKDTLEFLLKDGDRPHLVVICHSQGTVITLDTLFGYRDRDGDWHEGLWNHSLEARVASLTILTFGSPITHVYQHYFANLYPSFDSLTPLVDASRNRKVKWFNSYRIDDYIGTYIDPSLPGFPVNVPMSIGGHTNYWRRDVFERLFAEPGMETVLVDPARAPATGGGRPAALVAAE